MMDTLYIRLAEVTGREVDDLRADARRGRFFTVPEAVSYGLIEGQATPGDMSAGARAESRRRPARRPSHSSGRTPRWAPRRWCRRSGCTWPATRSSCGSGPSRTPAQHQLPPPFWAFPWAGGQALARYLLDHPGAFAAGRCSTWRPAQGWWRSPPPGRAAASVTPTETDPLAVAAIALNARANRVRLEPTVGDLLGARARRCGGRRPRRGRVLRPGSGARLLPFLDRASQAGALVLVGDPGRAYLPRDRFTQVAAYVYVPVERVIEDADVKPTTVWRLR